MSAPEPVPLPFVAPCRTLAARAPLDWLRKGWTDYRRAPGQSLAYGAMTSKQLLDDARKWKPHGYDTQIALRRDYYSGDQIRHLRNQLARRFPHTAHRMQPFVVNVFQHVVDLIAAIYRATPRREVFSAGSRDDVATQSMAALYSDAMVDTRMRRVEQIAAACGLAFVRVGWDEYDARLELTPFWPDCVGAVLHPDYPARIDRAYAIAARLSPADGLDSKDARYEIWTRGDDGWTCSVETSGGAVLRAPELHARLPWVAVPHAVPDGCLFELPPGDDVASQDALNAMYTDSLYTIEMQAYTQLTYTGAEQQAPQALTGSRLVVDDEDLVVHAGSRRESRPSHL